MCISTLLSPVTPYLTPFIKLLTLTTLLILLPYLVLKHSIPHFSLTPAPHYCPLHRCHHLPDTNSSNQNSENNELAERIRAHRAAHIAALDERDLWFGPENGVWRADREVIDHEEALRRYRERARVFQDREMRKEEEKRLFKLWHRGVISDEELRLVRRKMAVKDMDEKNDGKDSEGDGDDSSVAIDDLLVERWEQQRAALREEDGKEVADGGDANNERVGDEGQSGLLRGGNAEQRDQL